MTVKQLKKWLEGVDETLDVRIMTEVAISSEGRRMEIQIDHEVTDLALADKKYIVVIGQEI